MNLFSPSTPLEAFADDGPTAAVLPPAAQEQLDELFQGLIEQSPLSIGYPCSQEFDYRPLYRFLGLAVNNVGDPFSGSNYRMNTHAIEREVLADFARFTGFREDEISGASRAYWGYVTNGGTEGNMYGLYLARELFPEGIVYFSEDTHYSVAKILRLQHSRNIMIRSQPNGEMDYDDLEESLRIRRDTPPILFVNAGTTMTGAIDRVDRILEITGRLCLPHHYLHVDAALSGMILPFVDDAPPWNFADGIDSLSISGHKMLGSPLPCGVALARKSHVDRVARSVEYIGALDTTISGSRNAITPLLLWYALRTHDGAALRARVARCLDCAQYAVDSLREIGIDAWRHQHSITVVFPRPPQAIMEKWILAPYEDICHLITVPNVDRATIDAFVSDLKIAISSGS
ncbi:MAG TPA: histidine decarboxylase [Verrucomicrobiales bacterium]|nr:histidine decarboxylase [Verrucomicrobiales bacterium]